MGLLPLLNIAPVDIEDAALSETDRNAVIVQGFQFCFGSHSNKGTFLLNGALGPIVEFDFSTHPTAIGPLEASGPLHGRGRAHRLSP